MSLALTPQGIQIQTFDEIFDSLVADYKEIYGADIDLSQNTADGQRIAIEAKAIQDAQTAFLELYNSLDVDLSLGEALNRAVKYCGITKRPASYSTWDIDVTVSQSTNLNIGYTIKDDSGQEWIKDTAVLLSAGTTTVTFRAVDLGAVQGLIGSTFEQVTVIPTVTGFNAAVSANVGTDEETDFELRQRRNKSLENPAFSTIGSLTAKLLNLDNVTDAYVYENKTGAYNADLDLNAYSIWVVVEGGELTAIAEIMAKSKTSGTPEKGTVTATYTETLPSGLVLTHNFLIDRPTYVDVYITVDATRTTANPVDTALIAQNLANIAFNINDPVEAYKLYEPASENTAGFFLSNLQISDDDITFTDGKLDSVNGGKYQIQTINVTVNEIIP